MCDIPTVPLHCLSGKMSDSGSEGRTKRREKSREGKELIKSRRRTLNIGRRWRSGVLEGTVPVASPAQVVESSCTWGALVEAAVHMGDLGKLGSGYHDGHLRNSLPTQGRL